jgi:hypothetical protein
VGCLHQILGKKLKKSPSSARGRHSGKMLAPPGARLRHSGKRLASLSARGRHSGKIFFLRFRPFAVHSRRHMQFFFFECLSSPSVALGEDGLPRVPCFPECHALIGTRGSLPSPSATLGEDWLPRVPDFWHSGKHNTLGEFCFSHSEYLYRGHFFVVERHEKFCLRILQSTSTTVVSLVPLIP